MCITEYVKFDITKVGEYISSTTKDVFSEPPGFGDNSNDTGAVR